MNPRILIVGTVPYNTQSSSRAFDAYFHNWDKENLAQIFSNTKTPCKGHCGTLFQITDHRILKRWFNSSIDTGVIFQYEELPENWISNDLEVGNGVLKKAYRIGGKHTAFTHLIRGLIWKKKYWCTDSLNAWLDSFMPECVFLAFSDDFFINQIALYVANRYNVPIVSCIGDDYYFNKRFSISPLYHIYKETYKHLIRKIFAHKGSSIYISNKIRDKYNEEFGIEGETVYLSSTVQRKEFKPISLEKPLITYFGNIRMGRNKSLCDIANALSKINPNYKIEVFSNETDPVYFRILESNPNIIYGGSIPYSEVQIKMQKSHITIIVEGFANNDIEFSRYSLSTKAADALASGASILVYGSLECGIIEYMKSTDAAAVCTDKEKLVDCIKELMGNVNIQKEYYEQQIKVTEKNHNLIRSCQTFESVVSHALTKGEDKDSEKKNNHANSVLR